MPAAKNEVASPRPREQLGADSQADDNAETYQVTTGLGERRCPSCAYLVGAGADQCERCGADLPTGAQLAKSCEPWKKRWEAGLPLQRRAQLYLAAQAVAIGAGLFVAWELGSLADFLVPWLIFTGLITVLLGTYDRIDLSRSERGRMTLTKTWRICFWERQPVRIKLTEHEGVVVGQEHDVDFWDWLGVACLLPFGVVPAIVWWYYAFNQTSFFVALSRDHGYPATLLYRGWKEEQAKEIAKCVGEAYEVSGVS